MTRRRPQVHRHSPRTAKRPGRPGRFFELNLIDPKVNLLCSSGEDPTAVGRVFKRSESGHPAISGISLPAAAGLGPLCQVVDAAEGIGDTVLAAVAD